MKLFVDLLTVPVHATIKQFIAFIENLMGDDPALTGAQPEDGSINIVDLRSRRPSYRGT